MTGIKEAADLLSQSDDILLITHRRPDGDTLGSAAALCLGLVSLGKKAYVLENPEATPKYLPLIERLIAPPGFKPRLVAAVDLAAPTLFTENALPYADKVDLILDHHPTNSHFGRVNCVHPEYAAAGELVYEVLRELGAALDADMGQALYTAVSTDTGCFKYSNTTAHTHIAAAAAIETGFDLPEANRRLFSTRSRARIELEKEILNDMRFYLDGRVAVVTLWRDTLKRTGAQEDDIDDIAALPRQIEGVEVGVTIHENREGCRVSVRTSGQADASRICARLGGGGHVRAAGCNTDVGVGETVKRLVEVITEEIG